MLSWFEHFMKKNCKNKIKKNVSDKITKIKGSKLRVKWKGYDNCLTVRQIKKVIVQILSHITVNIFLNPMNIL